MPMKNMNTGFFFENRKGERTISKRLWLIMISIFFVIILFFMIAMLLVTDQANRDYEITEANTRITAVRYSIQASLENYKDVSRLIMINERVLVFLRAEKANAGITNDARYGAMDVLNACKKVDSVFIFRNDGSYMSTGRGGYVMDKGRMSDEQWQHRIVDERGSAVVDMNANKALYKANGLDVITISRAIYDILSQKQTGILMMNISSDILTRIVNAQSGKEICILDTEGRFLAGNEELAGYYSEQFLTEEIVHMNVGNGFRRNMISGAQVEDAPLVVLCSTHADANAVPKLTLLTMLVLLGIFLIAVFLATSFISRELTKPIEKLTDAMEQTKQNGYLTKLDVHMPDNEIGLLADSYNSMIGHLNELFNELIVREKAQQQAEIRVLHEQIKPHFLYNSLETISYLAMEAGADKVYTSLETLGSFYRNFLSKGSGEISLRREISIIQDYLSLQKLRYGEIIKDEYDIAEDTLVYRIPKLLLQPLVENCIYHGIRPKGEEGIIRITSYAEDGVLHLKVYDDGVGMRQEDIEHVLNPPKAEEISEEEAQNRSFGLRGTIERIRFYSNDPNAVMIRSELGEYTEIEIVIKEKTDVQSNAD